MASTSPTRIGAAGLQGWRAKVADGLAGPVSKRTPLGDEQVRAAVGALFFVLSVLYIVSTVREIVQELRS